MVVFFQPVAGALTAQAPGTTTPGSTTTAGAAK
jgi:hypothetical protein